MPQGIGSPQAGNTPACAGKSNSAAQVGKPDWKYPRVRGEELVAGERGVPGMEIPPRARGRARIALPDYPAPGNTPACAGKSPTVGREDFSIRKYPRVRGEEPPQTGATSGQPEIPPRARGRAFGDGFWCAPVGNTPACAGKRIPVQLGSVFKRKYPRVRGEEKEGNK